MLSKAKHHFYLFWLLVRIHLRTSDYRSLFGIFWSFTGPLATFFVLYLIFQDRFGQNIPLYALKLLTGVIAVTFFGQCVQLCIQAVKNGRNMLMYSLVPAAVVIFAPLSTAFCRAAAGLCLCFAIAAVHGWMDLRAIPLVLIYFLLLGALAAGLGLMIGTLNVLAADAGEIWQVLSPLLIFVTPVFYSPEMLSKWAGLLIVNLNPLSAFVMVLQSLVSGHDVPGLNGRLYASAWLWAFLFLASGWLFYKKLEKHLLEI